MGDGARAAERSAPRAGRSLQRQTALCRSADVEPRVVRRHHPSGCSASQSFRGRGAARTGGTRLKRMRLRTRVLLLTTVFALVLLAITFGLSWRSGAPRNLMVAGLAVAWIVIMC